MDRRERVARLDVEASPFHVTSDVRRIEWLFRDKHGVETSFRQILRKVLGSRETRIVFNHQAQTDDRVAHSGDSALKLFALAEHLFQFVPGLSEQAQIPSFL